MKHRFILSSLLLIAISFSSCFELPGFGEDPCTECQDAMNHLASALASQRLGCTQYVNSKAFRQVVLKCKNGNAKAYAILDSYCGDGHGQIPSACD